jgi:hypothetical protein
MKSNLIIAILITISSLEVFPQTPEWIDFNQRKTKFPDDQFLVGYYSAARIKGITEEAQLKTLLEYAKADIIENISVSIVSASQLITSETNKSLKENYSQQIYSDAKAEFSGLQTETWKDKKELFVLAYVNHSELIEYYRIKLSNLQSSIEKGIDDAVQFADKGNKDQALDLYYNCSKELIEAKQAASVLLGLQKKQFDVRIPEFESKIRSGIESILNINSENPDEAALVISETLINQIKNFNLEIKIATPTYQDTRFASPFSAYFLKTLENKLSNRGLRIGTNQSCILNGTYWKENEKIRFNFVLSEIKTGKVLATSEASIPISWFDINRVSYLPDNFEESYARLKAFSADEIINGGLHLELWTNKVDESPVFYENDTLKLYIRVNQECYLRFIYYMADNTKVLLMNDYYIGTNKVNKVVQIPESFICSEPFGNETLVLNAQTEPFLKISTHQENGYTIIDEKIDEIVTKSRGFKKADGQFLKAEKRLGVTTLKIF